MKMEFHRTNYNSSEAHNFIEKATHGFKPTVNVLEFF